MNMKTELPKGKVEIKRVICPIHQKNHKKIDNAG